MTPRSENTTPSTGQAVSKFCLALRLTSSAHARATQRRPLTSLRSFGASQPRGSSSSGARVVERALCPSALPSVDVFLFLNLVGPLAAAMALMRDFRTACPPALASRRRRRYADEKQRAEGVLANRARQLSRELSLGGSARVRRATMHGDAARSGEEGRPVSACGRAPAGGRAGGRRMSMLAGRGRGRHRG